MKKGKITFQLQNTCIGKVDVRKKKGRNGQEEEYAVIQVGSTDDFDAGILERTPKRFKTITLLCFEPHIFNNLALLSNYTFTGEVNLVWGGTFFKIMKAVDSIGLEVGGGKSEGEIEDINSDAKERVRSWNTQFKEGQKVLVEKDNGKKVETQTESPAYVIGDSAVILCKGICGYYRLEKVFPIVGE